MPFLTAWLVMLPLTATAADPPKKTATPASGSAAAGTARDEVIAQVNGERIMLSELIGRLDELGIPPERREDAAPRLLDTLIDNVLLVRFLAAQNVPYDAKAVDRDLAAMRAEVEKQGGKLPEALARFGMNEQRLRTQAIALARWDTYLSQRVSDTALADYLAKHGELFDSTEVRASHILVEVPAAADAATRAAAQAKIERIRKEVAGNLDFAGAARKYSDCPTKDQGGDVGWFPRRGKMVEPFARAAFALRTGQTSGVVETEFGYHVIKVTERKPGKAPKLADVRDQVRDAVAEELKDAIIARERKAANIEIMVADTDPGDARPPSAAAQSAPRSVPATPSRDIPTAKKATPTTKR